MCSNRRALPATAGAVFGVSLQAVPKYVVEPDEEQIEDFKLNWYPCVQKLSC